MIALEHIRAILTRTSVGGEAKAHALADFEEAWNCTHKHRELRVQINSAGKPMYSEQCLRCGNGPRGGGWISPRLIPDVASVPPFDVELREQFYQEKCAAQRQLHEQFAEHGPEWWRAYNAYLETAHWREVRRAVLERAHSICEGCGQQHATQVHHLTYANVGNEFLWELRAVCHACHSRIHPHMSEAAD